jgi:biotin transport system permease protein
VSGISVVHRVPAWVKLALLPGAALGVFAQEDEWVLAGALVAVAGLAGLARLPRAVVLKAVRPVMMTAGLIVAVHGLGGDGAGGVAAALRFAVLIGLAQVVTLTTPVREMTDALERLFGLLRPIGVNPAKCGLAVVLVLRFLPLLAERLDRVREARKARGHERGLVGLMVPMLVATLRLSAMVADAIDARGFDPD